MDTHHRRDLLDQYLRLPRTKTSYELQQMLVVGISHRPVDVDANFVDNIYESALQGRQ